jgi:hypothetical protein
VSNEVNLPQLWTYANVKKIICCLQNVLNPFSITTVIFLSFLSIFPLHWPCSKRFPSNLFFSHFSFLWYTLKSSPAVKTSCNIFKNSTRQSWICSIMKTLNMVMNVITTSSYFLAFLIGLQMQITTFINMKWWFQTLKEQGSYIMSVTVFPIYLFYNMCCMYKHCKLSISKPMWPFNKIHIDTLIIMIYLLLVYVLFTCS